MTDTDKAPDAAPSAHRPPSAAAAREVELKLHVPPGDLARVVTLPAMASIATGAPTSLRLRTVYYDTPDLKLAADGVALRVRRQDRHHVQALKTITGESAGDTAGIAVRREWEWPLAGAEPDLSRLDADGAGNLIPEDVRGALVPVFSTDFQRTILLVRPDPHTTVEIAVDDGEVRAGSRTERISEVELELKGGRVGRLFDLALSLQRFVPARVGTENKADVGYRLVTGREPGPVMPPPLALSPVTSAAESFRHIVRHGLKHLLSNEACVLAGGNPVGLHQIRIALRRLRLILRLFRGTIADGHVAELRDELTWVSRRLRAARRWDVTRALVPADYAGLAVRVEQARRPAVEDAAATLRGNRSSRLVLTLGAWLEDGRWRERAGTAGRARLDGPMADLAGPWLAGSFARARRGGAVIAAADDEARQTIRRRVRRHGYSVAFFRGLYPPAAVRAHLAALEPLLRALDSLDDRATAVRLLGGLAAEHPEVRAEVEAVLRPVLSTGEKDRQGLPDLWRAFREAPGFWA